MKKQRITFWSIDTCKPLEEELGLLAENGITIDSVIPVEYFKTFPKYDISAITIVKAIIIVSSEL